MSKELSSVYEQVALCCAGLDLEGRAIIVGVNGLDEGGNASFTKGLKAHLAASGREVAVCRLEDCANTAARQAIVPAGGKALAPAGLQRYCEESIDYDLARQAIQDLAAESAILIVHGVFLYTGALSDLFDLRLYLDVESAVARGRLDSGKSVPGAANPEARFDSVLHPAFEIYLREYDPASASDLVIDFKEARKPRVIAAVG